MKLHYISPSVIPSRSANSVHVIWQCRGLRALGVDVTLYASRPYQSISVTNEQIENVYGVSAEEPNLETIYSKLSKGINLRIAFYAARLIRRQTCKGDVILSRNLYAAFYFSVVCRTPILFETHQLEVGFRKLLQRQIMTRPWVKTIVISKKMLECLRVHHKTVPSSFSILHDAAPSGGTPLMAAERRSKLVTRLPGIRRNWTQVCGYFGHLHQGRGIEIIISMAKSLSDRLFLVFGGNESDIQKQLISNECENLIFKGYVPHRESLELMRLMDVLLMPYQNRVSIGVSGHDTARWMSPIKMFEYMSSGVPIISSNLPVLSEILRNNENSLLVSPTNAGEWINAVEKIHLDPKLAEIMSRRAYQQYLDAHTWEARSKRIIEAARELSLNTNKY